MWAKNPSPNAGRNFALIVGFYICVGSVLVSWADKHSVSYQLFAYLLFFLF